MVSLFPLGITFISFIFIQGWKLSGAVLPVFLSGRGHNPVSDWDLHDAFTQERERRAPQTFQKVDDLCYTVEERNKVAPIHSPVCALLKCLFQKRLAKCCHVF